MPSLEDLKSKQAEIDKNESLKNKQNRKLSLSEKQRKYEQLATLENNENFLLNENENETKEAQKKKIAAMSALKNIIGSIKSEYENAKKNPNSIFRDLFKKDNDGIIANKLDPKKVREVDDINNTIPKIKDNRIKLSSLKNRKETISQTKKDIKNEMESLYPDTIEYLKANYINQESIDKFLRNIKENLSRNLNNNPFINIDKLIVEDKGKIEDLKEISEDMVDNYFDKINGNSLSKQKEALDKVEKFRAEGPKILEDISNFENEQKDFIEKIWDIEAVGKYFGRDKNWAYKWNGGVYDAGLFNIIKSKLENTFTNFNEKEAFHFNETSNLDLMKGIMNSYRAFMKDILSAKDRGDTDYISNVFGYDFNKKYKEIIGPENEKLINRSDDLYVKRTIESGYNSIDEFKSDYENKVSKIEKQKSLTKEFINKTLDANLLDKKIRTLHNDFYNVEHFEKAFKNFKENLNKLKNFSLSFDKNLNSLEASGNLSERISLIGVGNYFPILNKEIIEIEDIKQKMEELNGRLIKEKEELINIKNKSTFLGIGKEKKELEIADKEQLIQYINKEIDTKNNRKIELINSGINTKNDYAFLSDISESELLKEKSDSDPLFIKMYYDFQSKEKNNEKITLKDYTDVIKQNLDKKISEYEQKDKNMKDYKGLVEEFIKANLDRDQSLEDLKAFFENSKNVEK